LTEMLDNLTQSVLQHPRRIWLIYLNPVYQDTILYNDLFSLITEYEYADCRYHIYSNNL
jgi:hypothetical protein